MNKKGFLYVCFSLACLCMWAQNNMMDSLHQVVRSSAADTSKVNALLKIAGLRVSNDPGEAMDYADRALKLAVKANFSKGIAESYIGLANAQITKGAYDLGITNLLKAIDVFSDLKNKDKLAQTHNLLANAYLGLKDFQKAYTNYLTSYQYAAKQPINKFKKAVAAVGVGNSLVKLGRLEEGLPYFFEAETLFGELHNEVSVYYVKLFIGEAYYKNKNFIKGKQYVDSAFDYFKDKDDEYAIGMAYQALGEIYYQTGSFEKAISNLEKSLSLSQKRNAWDNIQETALTLSNAYERTKNTIKALENYKLYNNYKDSVINKERNEAIANAESKYESKQKEQQLQIKNIELEKSALKINQRNNLIFIFSAALLLFIVLLVFSIKQTLLKNKININLLDANNKMESQKNIIETKNKEITDSITYAKRLQDAILPSMDFVTKHLENNFVFYRPKDIIAGDFYWAYYAPSVSGDPHEGLFFIAAADSTGHGVPGAMVSVVCSNALNRSVQEFKLIDTDEILNKTRELVLETFEKSATDVKDGMDISLLRFDLKNREAQWSGANNPLWYISNQTFTEIKPDKQPIGKSDEPKPFTAHKFSYDNNSTFYLFTDGYADQFGGLKGKKFKYKQMAELLCQHSSKAIHEQLAVLQSTFDVWKGKLEQIDDVCVIGIKI